jgi:hypothetical protein
MYTEILWIYPCMYLSTEDEMLKIYLSICTNMKLFYWYADEVIKINQHKYFCMKAMITSNTL